MCRTGLQSGSSGERVQLASRCPETCGKWRDVEERSSDMSRSSQHVAGPVVSRTVVDRRSVSLFVGLFVLGAVAGLLELLTDSDQTSTGATVAIANWVHVGLAVVLIVSLLVAYRRDRR